MSALPGRLGPIESGRLRGGILSAARSLPAPYSEWRQGVTFNPLCNDVQGLNEVCPAGEGPLTKEILGVSAPVEFLPFVLLSGRECSTWMPGSELLDQARMSLEMGISRSFAQQLESDPLGASGRSLYTDATDITGATLANMTATLTGLLGAVCECGKFDLTIHVPLYAIPTLIESQTITWDDSGTGRWMYGPWVVSADCYEGLGVATPSGANPSPGPADPAACEAWVYITGPVEVAIGDLEVIADVDERTNGQIQLVERLGILRYDPCCVYAAKALVC